MDGFYSRRARGRSLLGNTHRKNITRLHQIALLWKNDNSAYHPESNFTFLDTSTQGWAPRPISSTIYMLGWLVGFLTSSSTTRLYRGRAPRQERLTILRAATHEIELGDHDFCLSRSHYTVTDPTSRGRAATAGIEPGSSSPGVARSTAEQPRPPIYMQQANPFYRYNIIYTL